MRRRRVIADCAAVLVLLAAVLSVYLAVLLLTGGSTDRQPSFGTAVLGTTVVALTGRPLHRAVRRGLRNRLGVPASSPLDVVRRLPGGVVGAVPAEDLPRHLVQVLGEALRPRRAELWVGSVGHSVLAASWPAGQVVTDVLRPSDGSDVQRLRHGDATVGLLRLVPADPTPLSTVEQRLLDAWADQAGQVLALLARRQDLRDREISLAAQATELRLSRARLLTAERAERRRIERDLHDGAQQQLIALGLAVQLARRVSDRSPERARLSVRRAAELARHAGEELGRISESLYPALLRTGELAAALEAAAGRLGLPVTVDAVPPDAGAELDLPLRQALYFVVLESAQNAAKHGAAGRVDIRLRAAGSLVTAEIIDDGSGFDSGTTTAGAGLRHLRERLAEFGGTIEVRSVPGAGTTVLACVPRPARSAPLTSSHAAAGTQRTVGPDPAERLAGA